MFMTLQRILCSVLVIVQWNENAHHSEPREIEWVLNQKSVIMRFNSFSRCYEYWFGYVCGKWMGDAKPTNQPSIHPSMADAYACAIACIVYAMLCYAIVPLICIPFYAWISQLLHRSNEAVICAHRNMYISTHFITLFLRSTEFFGWKLAPWFFVVVVCIENHFKWNRHQCSDSLTLTPFHPSNGLRAQLNELNEKDLLNVFVCLLALNRERWIRNSLTETVLFFKKRG